MSSNVTSAHKQEWLTDGFVKIDGFFDEQSSAASRNWVEEIAAWPDSSTKWMHHRERTERGDVRLARTENFVPYHHGMKELLTQGRLIDAVSELLGEPAALYKEKVNYKYPGGGGYAAHQDAPAYDFITHHITCLVPIDPMNEANGCLDFSPGRHKEGLIGLDSQGCIDPGVAATLEWKTAPVEPGDILVFSSYAPHRSSPNHSDQPRRGIYLTYNALSEGDFREQYYENKRKLLHKANTDGSPSTNRISKIGHFQGQTVAE